MENSFKAIFDKIPCTGQNNFESNPFIVKWVQDANYKWPSRK